MPLKKRGRPKASRKGGARKRSRRSPGQPSQLSKPLQCDKPLSLLLSGGQETVLCMKRTEVVKAIWKYAKQKHLQCPTNGKIIICDTQMQALFQTAQVTLTTLPSHLAPHLSSVAPTVPEPEQYEMLWASPQLSAVIDHSGIVPSGSERSNLQVGRLPQVRVSLKAAMRWLGRYAKANGLRDKTDDKIIRCNARLKKLFGVDSFTVFQAKMLILPHLFHTAEIAASAPGGENQGSSSREDEEQEWDSDAADGSNSSVSAGHAGNNSAAADEKRDEEQGGNNSGNDDDGDDDDDIPIASAMSRVRRKRGLQEQVCASESDVEFERTRTLDDRLAEAEVKGEVVDVFSPLVASATNVSPAEGSGTACSSCGGTDKLSMMRAARIARLTTANTSAATLSTNGSFADKVAGEQHCSVPPYSQSKASGIAHAPATVPAQLQPSSAPGTKTVSLQSRAISLSGNVVTVKAYAEGEHAKKLRITASSALSELIERVGARFKRQVETVLYEDGDGDELEIDNEEAWNDATQEALAAQSGVLKIRVVLARHQQKRRGSTPS